MPKRRNTSILSPDRAAQALSILIDEGKLKIQDVARALRRRQHLIRELREKLASLGEGASDPVTRLGGSRRRLRVRRTRRPVKKSKRISKAQHAARQAQGRYMAAVRMLSSQAKGKVKAIREKSGVRAAIAAAKKMARG